MPGSRLAPLAFLENLFEPAKVGHEPTNVIVRDVRSEDGELDRSRPYESQVFSQGGGILLEQLENPGAIQNEPPTLRN